MNLFGIGLATVVACAAQAGTVTQFSLWDHPDGALNPPGYGLRFDGIFGGGQATFSMDYYGDTTLTVIDDGATVTINIVGTLFGGEVDGSGGYLNADTWHLDFSYTVDVQGQADGWIAFGEHAGDTGTLTRDAAGLPSGDPQDQFVLNTKADGDGRAFLFLADGHRLPNDSDWVGRGWFMPFGNGGTQDFLFGATLIPTPASTGVLALGGLMMGRRRRG